MFLRIAWVSAINRRPSSTARSSARSVDRRIGGGCFEALGLQRTKGGNEDDWWAHSPFSEDKTASFHISDKGWYCHSTKQGGGVIELVQAIRGINCYEAGRWLLENGLCHIGDAGAGDNPAKPPSSPLTAEHITVTREALDEVYPVATMGKDDDINRQEGATVLPSSPDPAEPPKENKPIRQTLLPALDMTHQTLRERGISRETAEYLGCGYLPDTSTSKLKNRIIFQIRGVQHSPAGDDEALPLAERYRPVVLSHIGRATTAEQQEADGKWLFYGGFHKHLELYNIDKLLLDPEALQQAKEQQRVLIVEGCMDVARLIEAKLKNVVATFGSYLSPEQLQRLDLIAKETGIRRFLLCYDRDTAGHDGMEKALELMAQERRDQYQVEVFDWEMTFPSPARGEVQIPGEITDIGEFTPEQLQWLREKRVL